MDKEYYTIKDIAEMLQMTEKNARALVTSSGADYRKINGRKIIISKAELHKALYPSQPQPQTEPLTDGEIKAEVLKLREQGLKQTEIAEKLNINQTKVSRILTGAKKA